MSMMMKCKNCHNNSHCDSPLIEGDEEKVICQMCRCEYCETIYNRWVDNEDCYTDERIV